MKNKTEKYLKLSLHHQL